eukprot:12786055-Alexandrium_andersonii.AAC.1
MPQKLSSWRSYSCARTRDRDPPLAKPTQAIATTTCNTTHIPATTSLAHHCLVATNARAHKQRGAVRRHVHLGSFVDV